MPSVGYWDLALVAVVALMSTALSYLHAPKWKALVLGFPFPFTIATMALGIPVGVSHIMGLTVLLLYTLGVRWLHLKLRIPIIAAIVLAVLGYIFVGGTLARIVPNTQEVFWPITGATLLLGIGLYWGMPHRVEPGHRSRLPVALKFVVVVAVVVAIVIIKNYLKGFMTFCPMVGILAAYESRHSLWTMGRQIPVVMIVMAPMLSVMYIVQQHTGLGYALLSGWAVFPLLFVPVTIHMWRRQERQERLMGLGNNANE